MHRFTQQELGPILHTDAGRTSLAAEKRKELLVQWDAQDPDLLGTVQQMTQSPDSVLPLTQEAVRQIFETLRSMDQMPFAESADAA